MIFTDQDKLRDEVGALVKKFGNDRSAVMPAISGSQDYPLPFDAITTDNAVKGNLTKVANRLFFDAAR